MSDFSVNKNIISKRFTKRNEKSKQSQPTNSNQQEEQVGQSDPTAMYDYESFHAALDYSLVKNAGPAARPLEFPTPTVRRATRSTVQAIDHTSGRVHVVNNVLHSLRTSTHAYLIRKKVAKSIYGVIRQCVVLKRRDPEARRDNEPEVEWESTDAVVVVKISSWNRMRQLRGRHLEDPIKEISALQLVGDYHPNVVGAIEVLQDEDHLYTVMQYCGGGDLFGIMNDSGNLDEKQARCWFQQLLSGLFHLQRKGVCHRDLSLENVMLDDKNNVMIIDLGLSLRVPYTDPSNIGCLTDVSEGTERRLMQAQGQGGKLMYMAPEVIARDEAFDGFAIDLWAAGVILFILLVGMAPFKWAHESDKRYAKICRGGLKELLSGHNISLSAEAIDLLQNMFWHDPRKRLTLAQVMEHPWVVSRKPLNTKPTKPTFIQKTPVYRPRSMPRAAVGV